MQGTIKSLVVDKKFGFIAPEGAAGAKDIFFHASSLVDVDFSALQTGQVVSFDVEQSEKGPRAANVKLA